MTKIPYPVNLSSVAIKTHVTTVKPDTASGSDVEEFVCTQLLNEVNKMSSDPNVIKINKWDGSAVKNALDDVVKNILTKKYNYTENFALLDGRLFLCGVAVIVAIVALVWDYLHPFPQSSPVLITCVSIYFALMGVLTLYTTYKEKGIFMVAIQRDPAGFDPDLIWEASSYLKKYDDKYELTLSVKNASTGVENDTKITKSVANFIDVNGIVRPELVEAVVVKMHDSLSSQKKDK